MGRNERPGDHNPDDQPEHERLQPGEIDWTGVVNQPDDLLDLIGDAMIEAQATGGEVPDWGARAMARHLANYQQASHSALHQFAVMGEADADRVALELAELWKAPKLPRDISTCIDWLGTYLIAQNRKLHNASERYSETTRGRIAELGPAYAAFLQLPDVTEDTDLATFHESYAGMYPSIEALIESVVETLDLAKELGESGVDHFTRIDPAKVFRMARETYDIVPLHGRYYCFWK